MRQLLVLARWLAVLVFGLGTSSTFAGTIEFPAPLHFLTPGGEPVAIEPGSYQVEPTESWIKIIPEGEGPEAAVLVEATPGSHEEALSDPVVRLAPENNNPDEYHLALLLSDGLGLEATGTVSGIRPRGLSLTFLKKLTTKSSAQLRTNRNSQGQNIPRTKAPTPGTKSNVDCKPYLYNTRRGDAPTIMGFNNKLHIVLVRNTKDRPLFQWTFLPKENRWGVNNTANNSLKSHRRKGSKFKVAWAVYQNRLHMVHTGSSSHNIYHSYFDGREWSHDSPIPGQKSKGTPALVVFRGELHMLHLGDSSNDLWHSVYRGKGWTVNKKIGVKSGHPPALAVYRGQIHMVTTAIPASGPYRFTPKYLYHSQYNGKRWTSRVKIPGRTSKASPALLTYGTNLHMVYLGNNSNKLRYSLYGWHPDKKKYEWYGKEKLLGLSSKSVPNLVAHKGCLHMAIQSDFIRHSIFAPRK